MAAGENEGQPAPHRPWANSPLSAVGRQCLIQSCIIEKSPGFGDVDTGNHNQWFPEGLWLHGIIYHLIVHYSAMWENLQSEWPVKLKTHTQSDLVFACNSI